jgi:hypothetical protein
VGSRSAGLSEYLLGSPYTKWVARLLLDVQRLAGVGHSVAPPAIGEFDAGERGQRFGLDQPISGLAGRVECLASRSQAVRAVAAIESGLGQSDER